MNYTLTIFNIFFAFIIGYLGITILGNEQRGKEMRENTTRCLTDGGEVVFIAEELRGDIPYCLRKTAGTRMRTKI